MIKLLLIRALLLHVVLWMNNLPTSSAKENITSEGENKEEDKELLYKEMNEAYEELKSKQEEWEKRIENVTLLLLGYQFDNSDDENVKKIDDSEREIQKLEGLVPKSIQFNHREIADMIKKIIGGWQNRRSEIHQNIQEKMTELTSTQQLIDKEFNEVDLMVKLDARQCNVRYYLSSTITMIRTQIITSNSYLKEINCFIEELHNTTPYLNEYLAELNEWQQLAIEYNKLREINDFIVGNRYIYELNQWHLKGHFRSLEIDERCLDFVFKRLIKLDNEDCSEEMLNKMFNLIERENLYIGNNMTSNVMNVSKDYTILLMKHKRMDNEHMMKHMRMESEQVMMAKRPRSSDSKNDPNKKMKKC